MKRKIKKFNAGEMVTSRGGDTNIRRRTDDEIAADNKAGYGRHMPKTKEYTFNEVKDKLSGLFGGTSKAKEETAPAEDRPRAKSSFGYEDMDGRMPAKSTMSGPIEYITEPKAKAAPEPETKAETKANSVDFSKYDTESYKPKSSTSTTGSGSKGSGSGSKGSGSGSKGSVAKPNNNSSSYAPPQKSTNKNNVVPDNYKDIPVKKIGKAIEDTVKQSDKYISPKNIQEERRRIVMKKRENDKAALENRKEYGMKKGGAVKSASARADGCAIRGKTRA